MKKQILRYLTLILLFIPIFFSCDNEEPEQPKKETIRTILIYMVASNSLSSCDVDDITEIESSIAYNGTNDCRLLVYWVTKKEDPKLIEIKKTGNSTKRVLLKKYDSSIRSTTPERMRAVVNDMISYAPAKDYGLVLWSHGSGWASSLSARNISSSLMDFGDDNGSTMPIDQLADALPSDVFTFIYTDACYMSGIEVVYELRDKTNYFIGSVSELPLDGMDYLSNIPCFFEDSLNLVKVCENTFNKYDKLSGSYRTCTISLIDCTYINEIAALCKDIHKNSTPLFSEYNLQKYKRDEPYLFYDFVQYTNLIANEEQKAHLSDLMNKVVIYKNATPYIFNKILIEKENYSGLSTYILGTSQSNGVNETYYKTLDWYNDVIK